mgnify:CR=1 FL=1
MTAKTLFRHETILALLVVDRHGVLRLPHQCRLARLAEEHGMRDGMPAPRMKMLAGRTVRMGGGVLAWRAQAALQRMQLQGLIASEWGHSINNRRARYYRLTPAGRRQLGETESSFDRLIAAISRVMRPA